MMPKFKYIEYSYRSIFIVIPTLLYISCGWDPVFYVEGKCISTRSKNWFRSVTITTEDPSIYYHIRRDTSHDGSNKLCLDDIPDGYFIIRYKDTLDNTAIEFLEGQTMIISYSGGDRAGINVSCLVRNDSLIVQN